VRWYSFAAVAALISLSALNSVQAANKTPSDQFAQRLLAGSIAAKGKSYACFARRYNAAHLAKHAEQQVTAMQLLVSAQTDPEDKQLNFSFSLRAKLRGADKEFSNGGECGHPSAEEEGGKLTLGCGIDCDGGGLSIEMVNSDKAILVRIERLALWATKGDGDVNINGPDDRSFLLERVDLEICKPMIPEDDDDAQTM